MGRRILVDMEEQLIQLINHIQPLDSRAMEECKRRWDSIAKPLHSLGKLEDNLIQIAGIIRDSSLKLEKKGLIIMCGDNGVVEEGVTQTGQEVTAIVSENFLKERATASILCKKAKADIIPVDIGIARDTTLLNRKIAYGTKNMTKEPAMTREQTLKAIFVGIQMVADKKQEGYHILATGEMGIGNTTTSSAVASVLLEKPVEEMTGRGAGLSSEGLQRKIHVIKKAIELHKLKKEDPIDVLAKVGGFDIAGLVGVFLGGAIYHVPIIVDGFISAVAALVACKLCMNCRGYMLASHISKEPAAKYILKELQLDACLTCDMCLGEGTGAVTLFPILDMAIGIYEGMTTFQDNEIKEYTPQE